MAVTAIIGFGVMALLVGGTWSLFSAFASGRLARKVADQTGVSPSEFVAPKLAAFSRQFGFIHGAAAIAMAFAWFFVAMIFIPDTTAGAVVLFVPPTILVFVGSLLILLRAMIKRLEGQ